MIEALQISFTVDCSPAHAFRTWTTKAGSWWPPGHTMSASPGVEVVFEPRVGGRIYERGLDGREHDWGEVTSFEPPFRVGYRWHLMFDPAEATDVTVSFAETPSGTEVTIRQEGWERLGERLGTERRDRTRAGWSAIVGHYSPACGSAAG